MIDKVLNGEINWHVEHGDALEVMRQLPDKSIDTFITSPPYWSLRSYLPADHPYKHLERGSEPNPGEFLDALLEVVDEAYRVLTDHGSLFINLGDTYAGSGGSGGDYTEGGMREGQPVFKGSAAQVRDPRVPSRDSEHYRRKAAGARKGLQPYGAFSKSLCAIPQAFMVSLVYGRNVLTGKPCSHWRVRNWLTWAKPNPAVGQIIDKWRPATEPFIFAVKNQKQFYDLQAIRRPPKYGYIDQTRPAAVHRNQVPGRAPQVMNPMTENGRINSHPGGAPPLDWQEIPEDYIVQVPTQYDGAHFATFPPALIKDMIEATCPRRVCRTCGQPSERIVEPTEEHQKYLGSDLYRTRDRAERHQMGRARKDGGHPRIDAQYVTVGWTDCGHDDWRTGIVLDPFVGSGTSGVVARRLNRSFIGIELFGEYERGEGEGLVDYVAMARSRIARALFPEPKKTKPVDRPGQEALL